jgi:hypothetical protein
MSKQVLLDYEQHEDLLKNTVELYNLKKVVNGPDIRIDVYDTTHYRNYTKGDYGVQEFHKRIVMSTNENVNPIPLELSAYLEAVIEKNDKVRAKIYQAISRAEELTINNIIAQKKLDILREKYSDTTFLQRLKFLFTGVWQYL